MPVYAGEISSIRILGHTLIVLNAFDPADAIFNKRSNRYYHNPRRRMGELYVRSSLSIYPTALTQCT